MTIEWAIAALGYAALEYWLGRTDKVRAGSVLEALLVVGRSVFRRGK